MIVCLFCIIESDWPLNLQFHHNLKKHLICISAWQVLALFVLSVHYHERKYMFEGFFSVWCFDWMSLSAKEAQQISCLLDKHQTTESVWCCVYTDNQWVVLSATWTLTLINHSSIRINFFSLSIVQTWLAGHDQEHMLCMIHILYISDMTLSQEIAAPTATEMLTVHTCGVKMNHMCAIGRFCLA